MVDRHAVKQMLTAGLTQREVAQHFGISKRTVRRIGREPPVVEADDGETRRMRGVGRPGVGGDVRDRMRALMAEDGDAPRLEILRQLREEGVVLGQSTFYRLYNEIHETFPKELMVRFEGVPGEFAQFDFGQVDVRLPEGRKKRLHFAAYRLKYSRWIGVVIVEDERVESLVRALLTCMEASGGVPLRVVFDRPKTVVVGKDEHGRPIWNSTLAQVAIDYGFTIELCAPRSPEQKGLTSHCTSCVA